MLNSDKEINDDIDATIDSLLENAKALQSAKYFAEYEIEALEKAQESLLARLMHRQSQLDQEQKKKLLSIPKRMIAESIAEYGKQSALLWKKRYQNSAKLRKPSSKSRGAGKTSSSKSFP